MMFKQRLPVFLLLLLLLSACSNSNVNSTMQDELTQAIDVLSSPGVTSQHTIDEQTASLSTNTSSTDESTPDTGQSLVTPSEENSSTSTSNSDQNSKTDSDNSGPSAVTEPDDYDYVLVFPSDRYPETSLHIFGAIEQGYSDVCTIDRAGADENRKESLKGIPTMEGYDRDEWPMAMCEEGGKGASVAYISASDNRGAGSWVGHELSQYEDGERILFIVEKPTKLFPDNTPTPTEEVNSTEPVQAIIEPNDMVFNSCAEARQAGAAPIKLGEPGYSKKLDRDGDGIACET